MKLILNNNIIDLAKILSKYTKIYIVGGYVRDTLLKLKPKDIDLTSSLTLEELEKALKNSSYKIEIVNKNLGTAKITSGTFIYEYTTFRKDCYSKGKHYPQKVEFVKNLKTDSNRRDFTINAIYFDILNNKIIDPTTRGLLDLKKHCLAVVDNKTLNFDGERILRLIKYACKMNFKIDRETFNLARKNNKNVYNLSKNMLESYKVFYNSLPFFKKVRAKRILNKLYLKELFF